MELSLLRLLLLQLQDETRCWSNRTILSKDFFKGIKRKMNEIRDKNYLRQNNMKTSKVLIHNTDSL